MTITFLSSHHRYVTLLLMTSLVLFIAGCSSSSQTRLAQLEKPQYVDLLRDKVQDMPDYEGSLYGKGRNPIFGDRKAVEQNDLLTIIISETLSASSTANKNLSDSSNIALGGGVFAAGNPAQNEALGKLNNLTDVKFNSSSTNSFTGSGTNSRQESFTTNITARVIKVMPNDTYYIEGSRELLINGEHQFVSVSGVVRSDDIGQNNMIDSKYIADAKIFYATKGSVSRANQMGWGLDVIRDYWPF